MTVRQILQPRLEGFVREHAGAIRELAAEMGDLGMDPVELDELVHEAAEACALSVAAGRPSRAEAVAEASLWAGAASGAGLRSQVALILFAHGFDEGASLVRQAAGAGLRLG